jgi:hypothetical protein
VVFEDGEGDLLLHDVDGYFGVGLGEAFGQGLFYLACAVGAADACDLDGEDFGDSSLLVL